MIVACEDFAWEYDGPPRNLSIADDLTLSVRLNNNRSDGLSASLQISPLPNSMFDDWTVLHQTLVTNRPTYSGNAQYYLTCFFCVFNCSLYPLLYFSYLEFLVVG